MFGFSAKADKTIQELLLKGALVVDVRSAREFASGHYKDSINIPLDTLSSHIASLKAHTPPIVVVCLSGGRSAQAVQLLAAHGVAAINGGGWQSLS